MRLVPWVEDLLATPDALASPQARILHAILKTLLVSFGTFFPILGLAFPVFLPRITVVTGFMVLVVPTLMWVSKQGHVLGASWGLVVLLFLIQAVLLPTGGGTQAPGMMTFLVITLVSGVLLGKGAGLGMFAACLAYTFAIAGLEAQNRLPAPHVIHGPLSRWATFALLLSVILGLQRLFSREVAHAIEVLQEGKDELAARVRARTAELAEALGELSQRNDELDRANQEARRATESKAQFLSIVSHELRSPLTSLRGSLALLRGGAGGEVNAEGRAMLEIAERNSSKLLTLVNELLDHQRVEAGAFRVEHRPLDLSEVLHRAVDSMQGMASAAGVRLDLHLPPGALRVEGDAERLEQVVVNLVSNALAHGAREPGVEVSAHPNGGQVRVEVANGGDPIPEGFRERMFQPFQQVGGGRVGSGLGLFLSKAIVEAHGGQLGFSSDAGRTCFHLDLPAAPEPI